MFGQFVWGIPAAQRRRSIGVKPERGGGVFVFALIFFVGNFAERTARAAPTVWGGFFTRVPDCPYEGSISLFPPKPLFPAPSSPGAAFSPPRNSTPRNPFGSGDRFRGPMGRESSFLSPLLCARCRPREPISSYAGRSSSETFNSRCILTTSAFPQILEMP